MKKSFQNGLGLLILLTLLVILLPSNVMAEDALNESKELSTQAATDFTLSEIDGGVSISGYTGTESEFTIPTSLNGQPVLAIGDSAFEGSDTIRSIVIPKSVLTIGSNAFSDCTNLEKIVIPSNVKTIGTNAFEGSDNVTIFEFEGSEAENYAKSNGLTLSNITESNNTSFQYVDIAGGIRITKYIGSGGNVTIPSSINGKTVLEIGDLAFYNCNTITNVSIPNSVKIINYMAFSGCSSLTTIHIPSSIESIGIAVFSSCNKLINIEVSSDNSNFRSVDGMLFNKDMTTLLGCPGGLKNVRIPEGVTTLRSRSFYYNSELLSVYIPNSVVSIESQAFYSCSSLTDISIPASVQIINQQVFSFCSKLANINVDVINPNYTSVNGVLYDKPATTLLACPGGLSTINIPNNVTSIGDYAFEACRKLTHVNLPQNVLRVGVWAFRMCSNLTSIQINSANAVIYDTENTFPTTTVIVGHNPSTAKDYAEKFNRTFLEIGEDKTLKKIAIASPAQKLVYKVGEVLDITGLSVIGTYSDGTTRQVAFTADNILGFDSSYPETNQVLTIAIEGITTTYTVQIVANDNAGDFEYVNIVGGIKITKYTGPGGNVTIPETINTKRVLEIGDDAFHDCASLTTVTIPDSVMSIGDLAFYWCSSLTTVNIPYSVTSIGAFAFEGCSSLTTITIPYSVTSIGESTFYGCSSLTNITIPDGITSIGYAAFCGCSSLTNINIPDTVTNIDYYAFCDCFNLISIQINSANSVIGDTEDTFPSTTAIIGHNPSTAKDYAVNFNRTFIEIDEDKTLKEIAITSPAQKLVYKVGETLDLTGLSVIGTYSDGTTRQMTFTADNILGFYSSYPETNQVLTIAIEGITTTYTIQIIASDEPIQGGLTAFLLKDVNGNFYEYSKDDINYSYVVFQMNPELPLAKMYQHFSGILSGGGKVIGLKDASKGYMDYEAAVTAFMTAQFTGKPFEMNAYLALNSSKKLTETVSNVQVVDKDGNITGIPSYSIAFYSLVTPGQKMVSVVLDVDNPADYQVSYNGIALVYNNELGAFQAEISSTTLQTLVPVITPV